MNRPARLWVSWLCLFCLLLPSICFGARAATNIFIVAAYNVENWLSMERGGVADQPKPAAQKQAVWNVIAGVGPDVIGLCEVGTTNDLAEIADGLAQRGLDYPHREWIQAGNRQRHVALLSRFPIRSRQSVTNATYQLHDRRLPMERGILDVTIGVNPAYSFRAVMVHLKSKRESELGDQSEMRRHEARLLREHVAAALAANPRLNLLLMGDFNDTPESETMRLFLDGSLGLYDLHPVSPEGWSDTHYWRGGGSYSRIDYLLVSPGMSNEFVEGSARLSYVKGWKEASDHRLLYARFYDHERNEPSEPSSAAVPTPGGVACRSCVGVSVMVVAAAAVSVAVLTLRSRRQRRAEPGPPA